VRSGNDKDVEWADATDLREVSGTTKFGDERISARIEHYWIDVPDHTEVSFHAWQGYAIGQHVSVTRNIIGGVDSVAIDK
jgi:hypothetical protein